MGVWTSGPRSRALALQDSGLRAAFNKVLPDWTEDDVAGSPYAIGAYEVPASLGGDAGLKAFRAKLNERGLKLLLDFVPNHLGLDHLWAAERPELFVQCPPNTPGSFEQQTKSASAGSHTARTRISRRGPIRSNLITGALKHALP